MQEGPTLLCCVAHCLKLAVLDAFKNNNFLTKFNSMIDIIFLMYDQMSKLYKEFHNSAGILDEDTNQFACLKKVQWLASRDQALKAVANNYKTFCSHFENISNYENYENTNNSAVGLAKKTRSLKFLPYLHFIIDLIPLLKKRSRFCNP